MKRVFTVLGALLLLTNAKAQLLNGGFETWETTGSNVYPSGWRLLPGSMQWERVTDAHTGSYAVKVSVWYYYTDTKVEQWAPISNRPTALTGWYRYTENTIKNQVTGLTTDDTAFAVVYLTKWNTTTLTADTVGSGKLELLGSASYKYFSCPITYSSAATPDTVVVSMDPSMMRNGGNYFSPAASGYNSYLTVDDIALQGATTAVSDVATPIIKIWPNPAREYVSVDIAEQVNGNVQVTDISGRVLVDQPFVQGSNLISLKGIGPGIYIVCITDAEANTVVRQVITRY
jgi:hypothetical protein